MPFKYQTRVTAIRETIPPGPIRAAAYRDLAEQLMLAMQDATSQERYRLSVLRHDALARARKEVP